MSTDDRTCPGNIAMPLIQKLRAKRDWGRHEKIHIFICIMRICVFIMWELLGVTGEFGDKYEFFLKVQLYPKFFFNDSIGMRDYQDLSTKEKQQYDMYCRVRFKSQTYPATQFYTDSQ